MCYNYVVNKFLWRILLCIVNSVDFSLTAERFHAPTAEHRQEREIIFVSSAEHREWVIGADAQLEKFLVHLDSFPVRLVEEPVGECDDGIPEIFVVT